MTHRLLARGLLGMPKKEELRQRFKYLLMLDFEATCEKNAILHPQEIIEFPCVAVSTEDWCVKDEFHCYVKPRVNPILRPFCTELTGIMQQMVDDQPHFPKVLHEFERWLVARDYIADDETSAFVTCGDWDLRVMLPNQCSLDNIQVPRYFERWIDLKKSYCEAANYYPRSLKDMLLRSDIPLEGRLHSGLCDSRNMAQIVVYLHRRHNAIFQITSAPNVKVKDKIDEMK